MKNKQTAVERLIEQIKKDQTIKAKPISEWNIVFEQAKKMEKEQIMESYMKAKLEHIDTLGLNAVKNKIIKTIIHDFLTSPLSYIVLILSWIVLGVLAVGAICSLFKSYF